MRKTVFSLRQRINLFIFENKKLVSRIMSWLIVLTSLFTIGFMVYYHGFNHSEDERAALFAVNRSFFSVFILNYLIRWAMEADWKQFLKGTWLEATLFGLLIVNFISFQVFRFPLIIAFFDWIEFDGFEPYYVFLIQCYLLLLILIETIKSVDQLGKIRLKPTTIFLLSFVLLISAGGLILMLPALNNTGTSMRFLDALFTSTSAACVTGLVLVDTPTFFNLKGQGVILVLIQVGGLGIISFATFFATFLKKGVGLKQQSMIKELFDSESLMGSVALLRKVVFYTLVIEFISAVMLFNFWGDYPFSTIGQRVYFSVFHAISAFCNAGFALFSNGFWEESVRHNYMMHLCIAATIFFGSLGFPAIRDIFEIRNVRERLSKPWKKWKLSTQIAFYTSLALVVFGAVMFYLLERNGTMAGMDTVPVMVTSIFQSVTTRTAGFNTVDFTMLGTPILIIMIFLMFVGASSGSTGGGIKTSTFVVIFSAILNTVIGRKEVVLGRRTVSQELIYKAFAVFIFSASFIFICVVILVICEPDIEVTRLVFEEVSAFATTGLSTGITAQLSDTSKVVLILSMFVGRIGILSLAFSLSAPVRSNAYRYPNSHIMIG